MKKTDVSRVLGQWHEFAQKFSNAGGILPHLQAVIDSKNNDLAVEVIKFIESRAGIEHIINTDALPYCENRYKIQKHKSYGKFKIDPQKLFDSTGIQTEEEYINGKFLGNDLKNLLGANATILEYFLEFPHLIPRPWRLDHQPRYFWGTTYENGMGQEWVRWLSVSVEGRIIHGHHNAKDSTGGKTCPALIYAK